MPSSMATYGLAPAKAKQSSFLYKCGQSITSFAARQVRKLQPVNNVLSHALPHICRDTEGKPLLEYTVTSCAVAGLLMTTGGFTCATVFGYAATAQEVISCLTYVVGCGAFIGACIYQYSQAKENKEIIKVKVC